MSEQNFLPDEGRGGMIAVIAAFISALGTILVAVTTKWWLDVSLIVLSVTAIFTFLLLVVISYIFIRKRILKINHQ